MKWLQLGGKLLNMDHVVSIWYDLIEWYQDEDRQTWVVIANTVEGGQVEICKCKSQQDARQIVDGLADKLQAYLILAEA